MQEGTEGVRGVQETPESGHEIEEASSLEAPQEVTTEGQEDGYNPKETARETVARVLKSQSEKQGDGDASQVEAPATTAPVEGEEPAALEQPKKAGKQKSLDEELDPEALPPERFSAYEKKIFNLAPKGLRKALHRTVKDLEANTTRAVQEYKRAADESRHIVEALSPFRSNWARNGITDTQAVTYLANAHSKLNSDDPQVRVDTFVELGRSIGVNFEKLAAYVQEGGAVPTQNGNGQQPLPDISQHPAFRELQQKLETVYSPIEQQNISAATAEIEAVRNEVDASGNLRFPELHDDSFLERAKPLVSGLLQAAPDLSLGDAFRIAYARLKGLSLGALGTPNQTKLPVANNNTQQRAQAAAVTVRGRPSPSALTGSMAEPPPEAMSNPRATVAWVLAQKRGV